MSAIDFSQLTVVNQSALLVVTRRAAESQRQDALFRDGFAEVIADLLPDSQTQPEFWRAAAEMAELSGDAVALRTRHFDDRINAAVARGVRQVVMLGVGFDGRSQRLHIAPDTRFYDVDEPAVLRTRQVLMEATGLRPKYRTTPVAADLSTDSVSDRLHDAGFDDDAPAVFVAEGLLYYLGPPVVRRLLSEVVAATTAGSQFVADVPAGKPLNMVDDDDQPTVTASFSADDPLDPWSLFDTRNWLLTCPTLSDLADTFGRSLPTEVDESRGGARWWYVNADRV